MKESWIVDLKCRVVVIEASDMIKFKGQVLEEECKPITKEWGEIEIMGLQDR